MSDLIRRQDVIDLLEDWGGGFAYIEVGTIGAIKAINELPSAQPERLTDKEQRIFLAAMGRERKICKEIDDEWFDSQNPHVVDSLVSVCNEIERKVKSELWNVK